MFLQLFGLWMVNCVFLVDARVAFIPSYQLEKCPDFKGPEANIVDTTEVDTHIENDTHVYFIGSIKFNSPFDALPFQFYTERYERGQWIVQVIDRKYEDMCINAHDKQQPSYPRLDAFPKCPVKAGDKWELNMIPYTLPEFLLDSIPPHYCGKWRGTVIFEFIVDGAKKFDCRRAYGDFYDDGKTMGLKKFVGR